jgi:glucose-1-phosphate adenylyltransferase
MVRDSVVFADTVIEADAHVDWAIVDRDCVLGRGSVTGAPATDVDDPDFIVLVGRGSRVEAGTELDAGARLEPGTTA